MRILLADDRPEDMAIMETVLKGFDGVEVIGKASELRQVEGFLRNHFPDVVFLDICFPERAGRELVKLILRSGCEVVLVTAYDEYALEAFRLRVRDYLLKPVRRERIQETLHWLREVVIRERPESGREVSLPIQGIWRRLALEDIRGMETRGNYTLVWMADEVPLICRLPLYRALQRFPAGHDFRQVSRQQVLPLRRVKEIHGLDNGRLKLTLDNGQAIHCSKRRSADLRRDLERLFGISG